MKKGAKEIVIPHDQIQDAETIEAVQERHFEAAGLNMHLHDVVELEDNHRRGTRHLKVKAPRTFVDLGRKSYR